VHDGLGSVRQLLDTTGQIETNYAYDPFGVPLVEGEVYNPYQFTGEAWDAEVELAYLRARYYQPEEVRLGPEAPLTQAVMRSPALFQFRAEWAKWGYPVPWRWYEQSYEPRSEGWIPEDPGAAAKAVAIQHLRLVFLGDPVGAVLGAFDDIYVHESPLSTGMVRIEAHNKMGWPSLTRIPGTKKSLIKEDRPRSDLGPGGTIEQWFYWEEPMPAGCWIRAYEQLFGQRLDSVGALCTHHVPDVVPWQQG
jgi:RHS repeat-associated protein